MCAATLEVCKSSMHTCIQSLSLYLFHDMKCDTSLVKERVWLTNLKMKGSFINIEH